MVCHYLTDLHKSQIKDSLIRVLFYWFRLLQKMTDTTQQNFITTYISIVYVILCKSYFCTILTLKRTIYSKATGITLSHKSI